MTRNLIEAIQNHDGKTMPKAQRGARLMARASVNQTILISSA